MAWMPVYARVHHRPTRHSPRDMNDSHSPDTVTKLVFTLEDSDYPLVRLSTQFDGNLSIVDRVVEDGESDLTRLFVTAEGPVEERVVDELHECDRADDATLLVKGTDASLLRMHVLRSVARAVSDTDGILMRTRAETGEVRYTVLVPVSESRHGTVATLTDHHPSLELVSITTHDLTLLFEAETGFRQSVQKRLTERQWEVLRVAFCRGYFSRPRGATQSDIADVVGISQETVSQHLSAAQGKLLDVLFEGDPKTECPDADE